MAIHNSVWSTDLCGVLMIITYVTAWVEVPKFSQMKLLYPGYFRHGGRYRDADIRDLIGANHTALRSHDTASLRMSYALNRYGGRHTIRADQLTPAQLDQDTYVGKDGQHYIFRNSAFGPYLSATYGGSVYVKADPSNHSAIVDNVPYGGKQGLVHIVSYHQHASGHVALWDCDHFHESRDWLAETRIIGLEFWQAPDSHCPKRLTDVTQAPKFVTPEERIQVIQRLDLNTGYLHTYRDIKQKSDRPRRNRRRHRHGHESESRINPKFAHMQR